MPITTKKNEKQPKIKRLLIVDENDEVEYDGKPDIFAGVFLTVEPVGEDTLKINGGSRLCTSEKVEPGAITESIKALNDIIVRLAKCGLALMKECEKEKEKNGGETDVCKGDRQ